MTWHLRPDIVTRMVSRELDSSITYSRHKVFKLNKFVFLYYTSLTTKSLKGDVMGVRVRCLIFPLTAFFVFFRGNDVVRDEKCSLTLNMLKMPKGVHTRLQKRGRRLYVQMRR